MLFTFNKFWISIFTLIGSWALFGVAGFEFTMVTLCAAILCVLMKKEHQKT